MWLTSCDSVDNFGVGTVVRSEDPNYKPGDFVEGFLSTCYTKCFALSTHSRLAFQEYSIFPGPKEQQHFLKYISKIERPAQIPATVYTGTLGLAGKSAFSAYDVFAKEKTKQVSIHRFTIPAPVADVKIEQDYLRQRRCGTRWNVRSYHLTTGRT